MKRKLVSLIMVALMLFSCAASTTTPALTDTPTIQDECSVCFNLYEFQGHHFIQIIDKDNNVVCWEDVGVVFERNGNQVATAVYVPVPSCHQSRQ